MSDEKLIVEPMPVALRELVEQNSTEPTDYNEPISDAGQTVGDAMRHENEQMRNELTRLREENERMRHDLHIARTGRAAMSRINDVLRERVAELEKALRALVDARWMQPGRIGPYPHSREEEQR